MNILPILLVLQWQVFFSPKGGTQDAIIRSIDSARTQVLVQAFDFTSGPIAEALKRAKQKGVQVMVIMEDSKRDAKGTKYRFLLETVFR